MSKLFYALIITILFFPYSKTGFSAEEEISLNTTNDTIDINCTLQLIAKITPENNDTNISWKTSDATVAKVNEKGIITGIGGGLATITASAGNGTSKAECRIMVIGKGSISSIMAKGLLRSAEHGGGVDLAVDTSGIPYLAFVAFDSVLTLETKALCEVWKYSSENEWSQFGERVAITDDEALAPGITIAPDNKVYVSHLYFENDKDDRYNANVVAFSTGEGWTYLGEGKKSLMRDGNTILNKGSEIAIKQDGTILVATVQSGDGRVHYWDDGWKSYSGFKTDSENFWAGGIDLECFGNVPLVSVRTSSGDGITGVVHGNENNGVKGDWKWRGGTYANTEKQYCNFKDEIVSDASLAVNSKGDVFTAYRAYFDASSHVVVKKHGLGDSSWSQIYSDAESNSEQVDVVVANDYLFLLVAEYDDGISIYRLTKCGKWVFEGRTARPDTYYNFDAVAGLNGEIFIGYECTQELKGQVGVFKYTPFSLD